MLSLIHVSFLTKLLCGELYTILPPPLLKFFVISTHIIKHYTNSVGNWNKAMTPVQSRKQVAMKLNVNCNEEVNKKKSKPTDR